MTFQDDLLALEQRVLNDAAGDFLTAVAELREMLAADAPGIGSKLARIAVADLEAIVRSGILDAHQLGGSVALADAALIPELEAGALTAARTAVNTASTAALVAPVAGLTALATTAVFSGLALLSVGAPSDEALAPVFGAANTVRGVIVSQVNAAANTAVKEVAEGVGSQMVWQAERDACVYCLSLAGKVVTPGEVFPDADLYAPQPAGYEPILEPPRHPNCRCTLAVLVHPLYAEALEREAQRSILRGFSLRSESQALRVRAAKRLLERDPVAPKSVKEYARKAVREGKFPRGRDVPTGDPRLVIK